MFGASKVAPLFLALCAALFAGGESATLVIELADEDGQALLDSERYVALIGEGEPLSKPAQEVLVEAGQSVPAMTIKPGRYRLLCGASGLALDLQPGWLELHAGQALEARCDLKQLVRAHGRIVDAVSRLPIRDARIMDEAVLLSARAGALTTRAQSLLLQDRSAISDETGAFRLAGIPDSRATLLIMAPGLAPYRADGVVISAGRDFGSFALSAGGSLEVTLTSEEQAAAPELAITLRKPPTAALSAEDLGADNELLSLLEPERVKEAGTSKLLWSSLPVGRLEVWAESAPFSEIRYQPEHLAEVEVSAGELSRLSLPRPSLTRAAAVDVARLRITASARAEDPTQSPGTLILTPDSSALEERRRSLRLGRPALLSVPAESRWSVRVDLPGYWAPTVKIGAGAPGSVTVQQLTVAPAGAVTAIVSMVEKGQPLPSELTVRFDSAPHVPKSQRLPPGTTTCPVPAAGKLTCPLPAGDLDLLFSAPNVVPAYRWAVRVAPGKTLDLGPLKLVRGASVTGFVETDEGNLDPRSCVARLIPPTAGRSMAPEATRLDRIGIEASVSETGFFQFTGVKPGRYLLRVEQPGYAAAELFPVEVWTESETRLREPLILFRPVTLRVRLEPAADWLNQPWRLEILRQLDFGAGYDPQPVFDGEASEEGLALVGDQRPGRFRLSVIDSVGGRWFSDPAWAVSSPAEAERTLTLEMIEISGSLRFGEEPVAGDLWFGGRFGSERVRFTTDEDGKFEGPLPRQGAWRVRVEVPSLEIESWVRAQVTADRSQRARIEIELPRTEIFGTVLDSRGHKVAGAQVILNGEGGQIEGRSETDGTFSVRAVFPGVVELSANDRGPSGARSSAALFLDLQPDQSLGPFALELAAKRRVTGRVVSRLGPVPGAWIRTTPTPQRSSEAETTVTDVDGRFEVQLPEAAYAVEITLATPGYGLKVAELPIGGGGILPDLEVEAAAGDLSLHLPNSPRRLLEEDWTVAILQDGRLIPLAELARWAMGQGAQFWDVDDPRLPSLAPGAYEVCLGPTVIAPAGDLPHWKAHSASCKSGFLSPGGTLELEVEK